MKSDKNAKWFYNHPNGDDKDDWGFNNGLAEARRLVGARQGDPDYVWVVDRISRGIIETLKK